MNPRKISLMATGGRTPDALSARAPEAAGPPFNMNQVKLTETDPALWMHGFWGHACGCGEDHNDSSPRR